jgi:hypothetical protein
MQVADRESFEKLFARLCAAFDTPPTPVRRDAYFQGFSRFSLAQFERCVDLAIGDDELDRMPTVPQLRRQSKRHGASERADPQPPTDARDHLEFFANRLLLQHVASRGGLGSSGRFVMGRGLVDCKASPELQACLRAKRSIVDEFASYVREGDELATPAEFMRAWSIVLRKVSKVDDALLAHWGETAQRPALQQPFPAHMARELP